MNSPANVAYYATFAGKNIMFGTGLQFPPILIAKGITNWKAKAL
jgi:hypothetical protein